jgi:beta-lactamase superfamily II metal-dependent hydrolase
MKLTFKDVGQGDSLILEWEDVGVRKIGIIDCNKKDKKNPVVEHLKSLDVTEVEFIILSHPHSDHYSGMIELLDYIESQNIIVKKFAHSLFILGKDFYNYLKWVETDTAALLDLQKLVERVGELRRSGVIKKMESVQERWREELSDDIYLKCLSPSQDEAELYMRIVNGEPEKNKREASSGANYLSTLFCLVIAQNYYLLTSDTENYSFERILQQATHPELSKKALSLGQLPHHGSSKNYYPPFWRSIIKTEKRHAVASAGMNTKYKHPHFPVLKSFFEDGYNIHCTSVYHGSREFLEHIKNLAKTCNMLDTFSTLIDSYTEGDKVF